MPLNRATANAYLNVDGWEYWTMEAAIADTAVINRAVPTD
jgi:hypothetical protein